MTKSHDHEPAGDAHKQAPIADLKESNTFYKGVNVFTKIFDGPATMFRSTMLRIQGILCQLIN